VQYSHELWYKCRCSFTCSTVWGSRYCKKSNVQQRSPAADRISIGSGCTNSPVAAAAAAATTTVVQQQRYFFCSLRVDIDSCVILKPALSQNITDAATGVAQDESPPVFHQMQQTTCERLNMETRNNLRLRVYRQRHEAQFLGVALYISC
jgi:hypothetical protein